jgi:5-oxopent-3-ene-1,2,5-tricarboxylate decarboxylase/2-hydroxyhepta-2,4-diene-1,7-dioate isomerase
VDDLIERLRHIPTATICDAYARLKLRPLERLVMRNLTPLSGYGSRAVGVARTQQLVSLRDPERGSLVANRELHFEIVDGASAGDFLVIACAGPDKLASFGDVLALKAKSQGVVGAAVDGAVRDAGFTVELELPVWTGAVTPIPQGYGGYSVQSVNEPVTCAGVEVNPGDFVAADGDGVVVVPPAELLDVLELSEDLERQEQLARDGIARGEPLIDLYPSRAYYAQAKDA